MPTVQTGPDPIPGLLHLQVRNFAIIDNQSVDFAAGMTVFTGETGAGKSLLVDALNLVLGERANTELIQDGNRDLEVIADFEPGQAAKAWLCAQALEDEDSACVLRRIIGADKRSRAFINGRSVPVSQLRELGTCLIDIHGQHAHQSLLKPEIQRQIVDQYGQHATELDAVATASVKIRALENDINQLLKLGTEGGQQIAFLRYQLDELKSLALESTDFEMLTAEHRRLSHGSELATSVAATLQLLDEDPQSVNTQTAKALLQVEVMRRLDPALDEAGQILLQTQALTNEAISTLRHYAQTLEPDHLKLDEIERRLSALEDLARKHQCRAGDLVTRMHELEAELCTAETAGERLSQAQNQTAELTRQYKKASAALTSSRKKTALRLKSAVNRQLSRVGLEDAQFEILLHPVPEDQISAQGERIEFLISTNPGQTPRNLARVASGGELSRIALALQTVAIGDSGIPTIVFDEVDAGIGGRVAEIVGRLMRELSKRRQVLTVTHLAQVAALAHQHIQVSKQVEQGKSSTSLQKLIGPDRVDEIARMLAGMEITESSRVHAREMLATESVGRPTQPKRSTA